MVVKDGFGLVSKDTRRRRRRFDARYSRRGRHRGARDSAVDRAHPDLRLFLF